MASDQNPLHHDHPPTPTWSKVDRVRSYRDPLPGGPVLARMRTPSVWRPLTIKSVSPMAANCLDYAGVLAGQPGRGG